jgi:hypothetical protein
MKQLLSTNGSYSVYVEMRDANPRSNEYQLRFLSTFDTALDPTNERVMTELILSPEDAAKLANFIKTEVDR